MAAPKQNVPLKIAEAAGEMDSASRVLKDLQHKARELKQTGHGLHGLMEVMTGDLRTGTLRGASHIAEAAADRLAQGTTLRNALQVAAGGAKVAGAAIGTVGAIAGTAYAGFEVGQKIRETLEGIFAGNAESMQADANRQHTLQEHIWSMKDKLGRERTIEMLGRTGNKGMDFWKNVDFRERSGDFADVIRPDSINIIYFLEINDKFYSVAKLIKDILVTGFAGIL